MKYIDISKLDIDFIIDEIFDMSKTGATGIADIISQTACDAIIKASKIEKRLFTAPRRVRGKVTQEMETCYLNRFKSVPEHLLATVSQVTSEFAGFYKELAQTANFTLDTFNSIGIHFYPKGSIGITPHQDFSVSHDLISVFVLSGSALFYKCDDREKTNSEVLTCSPRSLILMRAARNKEEQKKRPYHFIDGPLTEDRYSLVIRQETKIPKYD